MSQLRRRLEFAWLYTQQGVALVERNRFPSVVTGTVITLLLTLVYVFAAINAHTREAGRKVDDRLVITATVAQDDHYKDLVPVGQLAARIRALPNVKAVRVLSRQEVRQTFLRAAGDLKTPPAAYIFNEILEVSVRHVSRIDQTNNQIKKLYGIEQSTYLQKLVEKLTAVSNYLERAALYAAILMALVAVLVVMLTVRSAIHAERRSVEISASVGGSPWAIAAPHVAHALIITLVATFIACIIGYQIDPSLGSSFGQSVQNLPSWLRTGRAYGLLELFPVMALATGSAVTLIVVWGTFRYARR